MSLKEYWNSTLRKVAKTLMPNKWKLNCNKKSVNYSKIWIRMHWAIWVTKKGNWETKWETKSKNWKRNYQSKLTKQLRKISMMSVKIYKEKSILTDFNQFSISVNIMINSFNRVEKDSLLNHRLSCITELMMVWKKQCVISLVAVNNLNLTNDTY